MTTTTTITTGTDPSVAPRSGHPAALSASTLSPRRAARIAGAGYVALFFLALFANFFVLENLVVPDDATATAANIAGSEGLFRWGLVAFLAVFAIDVVVAWALYVVFREDDRDLSLVSAWFRLVYTVFLGVALVFFFQALQLLSGAEFLSVIGVERLEAEALVALETFDATWLIGLVAFGIHLVLNGALLIRSGRGPRVLAYMLIIAGVAYVVDTLAHGLLANYEDYGSLFLAIVAVPSVVAEGWFGLWLLFGARQHKGSSGEVGRAGGVSAAGGVSGSGGA